MNAIDFFAVGKVTLAIVLEATILLIFGMSAKGIYGKQKSSAATRHQLLVINIIAALGLPIVFLSAYTGTYTPEGIAIRAVIVVAVFGSLIAALHPTTVKERQGLIIMALLPLVLPILNGAILHFNGPLSTQSRVFQNPPTAGIFALPQQVVRSTEINAGNRVNSSESDQADSFTASKSIEIAVAVWAGGLFFFAVRLCLNAVRLLRLESLCKQCNSRATDLTAELATELQLSKPLKVVVAPESIHMSVPVTWGIRNPVIVLPAECVEWDDAILRMTLTHELGHILRRDWGFQLLAQIMCTLYWFNPIAWLVLKQLKNEAEIASDDIVINSGIRSPDYAECLLKFAQGLRGPANFISAMVPFASRCDVTRRVESILNPAELRTPTNRTNWLGPGMFQVLLVFMMAELAYGMYVVTTPVAAVNSVISDVQTNDRLGVKFVGVTRADQKNSPCWDAHGNMINMPAGVNTYAYWPGSSLRHRSVYKFILDIHGLHLSDTTTYLIADAGEYAQGETRRPSPTRASIYGPRDVVETLITDEPADNQTTSVHSDIASGDYKTIETFSPVLPSHYDGLIAMHAGSIRPTFSMSPLASNNGDLLVSISDATQWGVPLDKHFVLITNRGRRVVSDGGSETFGRGNAYSVTADGVVTRVPSSTDPRIPIAPNLMYETFSGIQPSDVKCVLLVTRPYRVYDFNNVALKPK